MIYNISSIKRIEIIFYNSNILVSFLGIEQNPGFPFLYDK